MEDIQAFAFSERARRNLLPWLLDSSQRQRREELFSRIDTLDDIPPFHALPDIEHPLREVRQSKVLEGQALRLVGEFLLEYEKIYERLMGTQIEDLLIDPFPLRALRRELMEGLTEEGDINERKYPEIRRLRDKAKREEEALLKRMETLLDSYTRQGWIRDRFITQRNGRYVLPLASHVSPPGVVHGLSNRESTLFVEPFEVVDLQNAWIHTKETLQEEIWRIFQELSHDVRRALPLLEQIYALVVDLERGAVLVRYARERQAVWPETSDTWDLQEVRHPVLLTCEEEVVPFSLAGKNFRGVVLSGPNAGGKTALLKTVGLAAVAVRYGIPFPGRRVRGPHFNQIWAIGFEDPQNIARGASSFTGIAREIRELIENLSPPALVLLDEPFASTDPQEGSALAYSVVRFLMAREAQVWITTHLTPLKVLLSQEEGVLQGAMRFDGQTGRPLYDVAWGEMGESHAMDILKREGFPPEILEDAQKSLALVDVQLGRLREEAHHHANEARKLFEQARRQLVEAQQKAQEIEARARDRAYARLEKVDREVQKALRALQQDLRTREDLDNLKKIRKRLHREKEALLQPEEGDAVAIPEVGKAYAVRGFGIRGKVLEIRGKRVVLEVNGQRMEVDIDLLRTLS